MDNSMINPSIISLLEKVDNRYSLVTITSRRARQLIDGDTPLIPLEESSKPLTIAINEVDDRKVVYENIIEGKNNEQ